MLKALVKSFAVRAIRPGLAGVEERLARLESRLEQMTGGAPTKYADELAWWRWLIKTEDGRRSIPGPFEQVFGAWQRDRLRDLGRCLGLESDDELDAWCARQSAVEIGAGPYPALAAAPLWRRAVAIDPLARGYADEGLLTPAAAHVVYIDATGERIPLPAAFADVVIIENALDHVTDPAAVLAEIWRVLRPGGVLWLLVDLSNYRDALHPHPFDEARARLLLGNAGFEIVSARASAHKSHPKAYGEFRALARRPDAEQRRMDAEPRPARTQATT